MLCSKLGSIPVIYGTENNQQQEILPNKGKNIGKCEEIVHSVYV